MIKWKYWDDYNPEDYLGFVYKITNLTNGKFYIGKKFFWYNKKKKLTKKQLAEIPIGPGRKPTTEIIKVESDWKTYWGSSKELLKDVKELGEDHFECIMLKLCKNKKQLTYFEMHYQCTNECLTCPSLTYNDNILGKFFGKDLV
jgi:hypothetical protein